MSSSKSEKPYGITNIKTHVPLILDQEHQNYDSWRELFKNHCKGFGVYHHLLPKPTTESTSTLADQPKDKAVAIDPQADWEEIDAIVKAWIYDTLAQPLLNSIIKKNTTAYDVWITLENLFYDNKDHRLMELDTEIRNLSMGDSSMLEYLNRVSKLADMLENLGAKLTDRNLIIHTLNGLPTKYDNLSLLIRNSKPFPSFAEVRPTLTIEEKLMKVNESKPVSVTHTDHPSSPTALSVQATGNVNQSQNYRNNFSNQSRGGGRTGGRFNRGGRFQRGGGRIGHKQSFSSGFGQHLNGQQLIIHTPWGPMPCSLGPNNISSH